MAVAVSALVGISGEGVRTDPTKDFSIWVPVVKIENDKFSIFLGAVFLP